MHLRIDGGFSAGFSLHYTTRHQASSMNYQAVEQLLTQDARLLARRDAPVIDQELEEQRQAALEIFFQWQDGMREYQDLMPFCVVLQRKVDLNRDLLRWERRHED
jgi:tryptophan 2,3-dioxygenase